MKNKIMKNIKNMIKNTNFLPNSQLNYYLKFEIQLTN